MEQNGIELEHLVEVKLPAPDDFLKVKETLTRIGISSNKDKKLYQSCHILHKRGKYYIVHFKEMFALDNLPTDITDNDIGRRNTICSLLEEWNLIKLVDPKQIEEPVVSLKQIKILPHKEKDEWELCPKYHMGKNRKGNS